MGYLCLLEHRGWDRLVIQALAIRWTVRRLGWARRLLEQVIREGKAAGWGAIRLEVGDANEEALALYQGLGFRPSSGWRTTMAATSTPTGWRCCW